MTNEFAHAQLGTYLDTSVAIVTIFLDTRELRHNSPPVELPKLNNFPPAAKYLTGLYVVLIGLLLVVALSMATWHQGFTMSKKVQTDGIEEVTDDDDDSPIEVVEEGAPVMNQQPWFLYDNFKLGHAHLNGQTLVFFTVVLLFALTTAAAGAKKLWGTLFALFVLVHTVGLFFKHKPIGTIILIAGGSGFALCATVMALYILRDLIKNPD